MIELPLFVTGFTQAFKMAGVPTKFLPLIAIFIGGLLSGFQNTFTLQAIAQGVLVGMATTGIIDRIDETMKTQKSET